MTEQDRWWSAQLRMLCLVEHSDPREPALQDEQVIVFRAADRERAFERALAVGRSHEHDYLGGEGDRVRWVLHSVLTLDALDAGSLDGVEVHSRLSRFNDGNPAFDTTFHPERIPPDTTGIGPG